MSELTNLTDAQLSTLRTSCQDVLRSVVDTLKDRADMQEVISQMINSEDMTQGLAAVPDDDLKRLTLQASVAALVNTQSATAIDAELSRRAELN